METFYVSPLMGLLDGQLATYSPPEGKYLALLVIDFTTFGCYMGKVNLINSWAASHFGGGGSLKAVCLSSSFSWELSVGKIPGIIWYFTKV